MPRRIESPSSINMYKQCPRKYYFAYIKKLPTSPSIHTVRGNIMHSLLEDFYELEVDHLTFKNYQKELKTKMQQMLLNYWLKNKEKIKQFGLTKQQEMFYFEESMMMMFNWFQKWSAKVAKFGNTFPSAFRAMTPIREQRFISAERSVQGFIDVIENFNDEIRVMDYKTSKKFAITEDYKLQLALYALMYKDKHGVIPDKVGIYFLKDDGKHEHILEANEDLVTWAKEEVEVMHYNTKSDDINDYPQNRTPLCKWSTGKCDFYEKCFGK